AVSTSGASVRAVGAVVDMPVERTVSAVAASHRRRRSAPTAGIAEALPFDGLAVSVPVSSRYLHPVVVVCPATPPQRLVIVGLGPRLVTYGVLEVLVKEPSDRE